MVGEETRATMRVLLLWSGFGVLLVAALFAAFGSAQRAVYSPSGFVSAYVGDIADHDVAGALGMPGAAPTNASLRSAGLDTGASRELLRSDVLPQLTDTTVVSDTTAASGVHRVAVRAKADGHPVTAVFSVRQTGSVLGLLPTWEFAASPLGVAQVTVAHAQDFTIGGHTIQPAATAPGRSASGFSASAGYLVFAPARYELGHASSYLTAAPSPVTVSAGRTVDATVDAEPTAAFTTAVQTRLDRFLDSCARQQVLQPAGCPLGVQIDDRVQGTPHWAIVHYPTVHLEPGRVTWIMAQTPWVAHLSVTVQSLFDGTVSHRESDERFTVSLSSVVIRPGGSLSIVVSQ